MRFLVSEQPELEALRARLVGGEGGGIVVVGDDAVDTNDDVLDLGDEGVESLGNDAASAEGFDVADAVEDEEEDGVGEVVEEVGLVKRFRVDPRERI
ncbi:hypothetical protein DY000_02037334 [Brassica cretica]|uniref:Uncharacterized protein n=1 Tax=Brassica cretica TaxID=69181 RepID=A0ABQ7BC57_BRACR|nr:hypothetical protein DY000_02037334 [Brassica cretica]